MVYEELNTTGFLFQQVEVEYTLVSADFGDGYSVAALIGSAEGLRSWNMSIEVLPDNFEHAGPIPGTGETRAAYLWRFFKRSKVAGNRPFWFRHAGPGEGLKLWLVEFTDDALAYPTLCAKIYAVGTPSGTGLRATKSSSGLMLRQRRVKGVVSPVDIPEFLSGEIGLVDSKTVVIAFSANVAAANFLTGVTIRVAGDPVGIVSATRQADHSIVRYVLSAPVVPGAIVTWAYASGVIAGEVGGVAIDDGTQPVTNNVVGSFGLETEGGDTLITEGGDAIITES